tara:strand:+ start:283 stop:723 length:441 start_codon:yes stop_codon:yes gene_type:complete
MTEEELRELIGPSTQPSQDFIDFSKGGASSSIAARLKMQMRERIKAMLSVGRRNTEQTANLFDQDILTPSRMEQRNIDPRDYGAPLPPNAPQIPKSRQGREQSIMERWLDQLRRSKENLDYDFDREEWIEPPPPQLTGRFRDRMAF